ncbi:MAG: ATP-binding protein [Chloroflexi bacterium]|nr:ATP-binding protein [Chloroflexota bacterium]
MPEVIYDSLTNLPLITTVLPRVKERLEKKKQVGFLYFDVVRFQSLEKNYGREACNILLGVIGRTLGEQRGKLYREEDLVAVSSYGADYFVVFLFSPPRQKPGFETYDLKLISFRILQKLMNIIQEEAPKLGIQEKIEFHAGYSLIARDPYMDVERLVYEAQKEAAFRSQLEEVMVKFVSNISHELRTPLTCIKGYAETMLEGALEDRELSSRWLTIISQEATRLEALINDLLDLSLIEARQVNLKFSPVNLSRLVKDSLAVLYPLAQEKNIDFIVEAPARLPKVMADQDRLQQVITNLVHNAIKYSDKSGKIKVKVQKGREQDLVVSVIDYGVGIPAGRIRHIFDRFYRGKNEPGEAKGSGLGLAIVKQLVEAHGGQVKVTSTPGKGSNFKFNIPAGDIWKSKPTGE